MLMTLLVGSKTVSTKNSNKQNRAIKCFIVLLIKVVRFRCHGKFVLSHYVHISNSDCT